jgi:DNA polymerase-3 subunit gamma/tau
MGLDQFIVSARKYRPQTFDTVVGQSHITTTLRNAIKNQQLAHAFLFCGPRGVGKTTCARILAKTINCEKQTKEGEACNKCHSCQSFNEGTSLNIHELDAASNNSVDDIRSLVDQVRFAPQAGKYKVYIIDEVHMLSTSAFNAFLKTLEEPPPYAIFILATTEKHKILPTILSRCQIFDFKRITANDTAKHLEEICQKEHIKAERPALQVIAQKSEGCMRDALSIMDKIVSFTNGELTYAHTLEHLNILDADQFFQLLDHMQRQDLAGALLLYDDINKKGFEGDTVLNGYSEFIRNLLVCKEQKVAGLLEVVESFKDKYIEVAQQVPASWLLSALNILNESEINYKMARNKRLHVELALIKLTYLSQALSLAHAETGSVKKKVTDEAKPVAFRKLRPIALPVASPTTSISTVKQVPPKSTLVVEIPTHQDPVVQEQEPELVLQEVETSVPQSAPAVPKLSKLAEIRKQFSETQKGKEAAALPLEREKLQQLWNDYAVTLKKKRSPAAQPFERARLFITDTFSFEVVCNNQLEMKFIEQERTGLTEILFRAFNNNNLQYSFRVEETTEEELPQEKNLGTKEQFRIITASYPLVRELKDRLNLELDY